MTDAPAIKLDLLKVHPAMKAMLIVMAALAYIMMPSLVRGLCVLAWSMYFLGRRMTRRRVLIVLAVNAALLTFGHLTRGPRRGDHLTVQPRFIRLFGSREDVEDLSLKYHAGADRRSIFTSFTVGRDLLLLKRSKFLVLDVSGDVAKVALEQPGHISMTDGGEEKPVGSLLPTMFVFLPDLNVTRPPVDEPSHKQD